MKDYFLYKNKKEKFILEYSVSNNNIIIKYKDCDILKEEKILYTKEKELEILNKMEQQVNDYPLIKSELKICLKASATWAFMSIILLITSISLILSNNYILFPYLSFIMMMMNSILNISDTKKVLETLKDLEKSKFYLENKDNFNDDKDIININSISKYTLNELKTIGYNNQNKVKKLVLIKDNNYQKK